MQLSSNAIKVPERYTPIHIVSFDRDGFTVMGGESGKLWYCCYVEIEKIQDWPKAPTIALCAHITWR